MQALWRNWCRLCGKDKDIFIDILIKDENFSNLSETIQKFFSISMDNFDAVPTKICQNCYEFIINLLAFSLQCKKVQDMYAELQFNDNFDVISDLEILRQKYGLVFTTENQSQQNSKIVATNIDEKLCTRKRSARLLRKNESIKCATHQDDNDQSFQNQINPNLNETTKYTSFEMITKIDYQEKTADIETNNNSDSEQNFDECTAPDDQDNNIPHNSTTKIDTDIQLTTTTTSCGNKQISDESNSTKDKNISKQNHTKITCEKCPKVFTLMARYLIHLKNKHSIIKDAPQKVKQDIIMYCKVCKKGFSNRGSYHLHLKVKHSIIQGPVIHTCHECNKDFKTSGALKSHARTHLKIEERIWFPCNLCNKKFSSEYICETHIRTKHHGEKPFICDQCGKTLTSKRSLYFHTFVHTENAEPLQCEICSKLFTNQLRLQVHMKTHSQISVNCPICNLKLKNKTFLNHHMITHSDEKNFKCTYCGNEFKRKKNLRTHMIIHTGLKPYECPFCSQSFANRSNCKKHQKHSHPEDFAALEATGKEHYSKNIPKLTQLQAMLDQMKANRQD